MQRLQFVVSCRISSEARWKQGSCASRRRAQLHSRPGGDARGRRRTASMAQQSGDARADERWESIWRAGVGRGELFDARGALPELVRQLGSGRIAGGGAALVPGCGRGYDVEALSRSRLFDRVLGVDISATGVREAAAYLESVLPKLADNFEVRRGDFFDGQSVRGEFGLVYDYTFFCAIPLERRGEWAERMKELVRKGGNLITVMYPVGKDLAEGGPPFGTDPKVYAQLLEGGGGFERRDGPRLVDDDMSHGGREGRTWWCRWERV